MFIRLFVETNTSDDAFSVLNEVVKPIQKIIEELVIQKNEPYWKIDGIYIVEVKVKLYKRITTEETKLFLDSASNKWSFFGNPVDEALASLTMSDDIKMKEKINMINIFFSE